MNRKKLPFPMRDGRARCARGAPPRLVVSAKSAEHHPLACFLPRHPPHTVDMQLFYGGATRHTLLDVTRSQPRGIMSSVRYLRSYLPASTRVVNLIMQRISERISERISRVHAKSC